MPMTFARADPIQYLIDQSMRRNRIERRDIFDDFRKISRGVRMKSISRHRY